MTMEFTSSEYKMILWSFDYIQAHLDITTDQLPELLVKFWRIPDFFTSLEYKTDCVQVFIFMYVLRMNKWPEQKLEDFITTFHFNRLFYSFQLILATIDYCRENNIAIPSFPLFDLQQYSLPEIQRGEDLLKQYEIITGEKRT